MHIETQAELLKLSRLLETEENDLAFLDGQDLGALASFRSAVSGFFYEQHQDSYQRLAGISKLVPTGASAKLATTVLGSVLAAGIASELPAERAIKLADKLPEEFLAKLCIHLEPKYSRDLLAAMPDKIVASVAKTLLAMGEHITLARFVAVIQPSALKAVTSTIDDGEAMVKIALYLEDKSKPFNTARIEALELDNLLEVAEATAIAAEGRTESRGAHSRYDYPDRDDENWLCHSIFDPTAKKLGKRDVNFKPKTVDTFQPKARTY